jgi:hypothetical protein
MLESWDDVPGASFFFEQESDNEFDRPLPILRDYLDWRTLKDDFYKPNPRAPGSWIDLYWWRVITGMINEWEAEKYRSGSDKSSRGRKREPDEDGLVRRPKDARRKMPKPLKRRQG